MKIFQNIAKDTLLYGSGDLLGKLIAFIVFPLVAAAVSPKEFGILDLIMTTVSLMGVFIGCGLNNAVQRYYWDKDVADNQKSTLVSSGLLLQIIFGCIFLGAAILIWPVLNNIIPQNYFILNFILFLSIIVLICGSQWIQYIQDITRLHFAPFKFLFLSFFIRSVGAILALAAVVHYNQGIEGFVITQAVVILLAVPVGMFMVRKDITRKVDPAWMRRLFHYGHPFIFTGIAYWLFGSMDRWMLASMSSVEETGIYSVAFRFASLVLFVSTAFGQAWSPHAVKIQTDHPENYRSIYGHVLLYLVYIMLIAGGGLALFSGEIIHIFMPLVYEGAALPLAILCFAIVFQATQQVTAVGISLEKKTYIFANLAWIAALLNFGGNFLLIPVYGASGAALATLISYLTLTGGYIYYTQKLHPLQIDWKKLFILLALGGLVAAVSIVYNSTSLSGEFIMGKILLAILCLALGALVLPKKELKNVKAP